METSLLHPSPRRFPRRLELARLVADAAGWLSRRAGRGAGGVIGGRVLLALAPDAAALLSAGRHVALVSGTNGKSTTTAMTVTALRSQFATDTNSDGANVPAGLVRTLASGRSDHVVLETDEGWLPWAVGEIRPSVAVLLNLSRDQLHRHPEVHAIASLWRAALSDVPLVVANADDPGVVWAASEAAAVVWVAAGRRWTADSTACPACHRRLVVTGDVWGCACGFTRPTPRWWLEGAELVGAQTRVPLRSTLPGTVNIANAAMAVVAAVELGTPLHSAVRAVAEVDQVAGRYAVYRLGRRSVRLLLAKNPAGWLEAVDMVVASGAPIVIAFNCDGVDGRDPSWLYDVDLSPLRGRRIAVCGRRRSDMTVRLSIEGFAHVDQYPALGAALRSMPPGRVDVIANYTAFQSAHRWLLTAAEHEAVSRR